MLRLVRLGETLHKRVNVHPHKSSEMKSVYLRVDKIGNAPGNEYYRDSRCLCIRRESFVETKPLRGLEELVPEQPFSSFTVSDLSSSSITFELWETKPRELRIASLTIPLYWFQLNTRVKERYPMQVYIRDIHNPVAEIEFHVDDASNAAFSPDIPVGTLVVTPEWEPGRSWSRDKQPLIRELPQDDPFIGPANDQSSSSEEDSEDEYSESSEVSTAPPSRMPPVTPASIRSPLGA